jgi:kynureninase
MDIFQGAGIERLRKKSIALTGYLEFLLNSIASPTFSIITPQESKRRGAQLSLRIRKRGRELCTALAQEGILGDTREPDILRVAPLPLYNSYRDVYRFAQAFSALIA